MTAPGWVYDSITRISPNAEETKPGREWILPCPVHEADGRRHRPSLSVTYTGERLLVHCFAGCAQDDILRAVGLDWRALCPPRIDRQQVVPAHRAEYRPSGSGARHERNPESKQVAFYSYCDAEGKLLYQVVRNEPALSATDSQGGHAKKDFSQRRPDGGGGWIYKLDGVPTVLYHLPDVITAVVREETILLPEGEKDVDGLRGLGMVATCNPGGAGKWRDGYSEALRGADVVILPDNDEPGRKHRDTVATALQGIAARIRVIELPDLPEKGDVSDWLKAGGTPEELRRLIETAPEWKPAETTPVPAADPWSDLLPFGQYTLPTFPTEALPEWLRAFVEAVAGATATPPDLAGMLALAVVATAAAKRFVVALSGQWYEPTNLFAMVVLPPGSRKSAVFRLVTHPIEEYERAVNQQLEPEIAQAESQQKILQGRLSKLQQEAARAKEDTRADLEAEAARMAEEVANFKVPVPFRLVADDVTPERCVSMLADQGGRLALMSPEGGIFDILSGRYSEKGSGPNLDAFLKGHSGDSIRVDRVGRSTDYVDDPALTLGLAVQPDILRGLMEKPGFRGRGLLARFLYALPADNIGYRSIHTPEIPADVQNAYTAALKRLLMVIPQEFDGRTRPSVLTLTPEADAVFTQFREEVEVSLRPDGNLYAVREWGSKLAGATARLAALLHVAEHADTALTIRRTTMRAAILLARYCSAHALAAHAEMGADADSDGARALLAWLTRTRAETFRKREAHNALQGRFRRSNDLDKPIEILCERGYIREGMPEQRSGPGRKPSNEYEVNPALHNLQNVSGDAHFADCVVDGPTGSCPAEELAELRAQVRATWERFGLEPTPDLLRRLIGRDAATLSDAIQASCEPELQRLLRFAKSGQF
jgi:hypothetical protein